MRLFFAHMARTLHHDTSSPFPLLNPDLDYHVTPPPRGCKFNLLYKNVLFGFSYALEETTVYIVGIEHLLIFT